jgi:hypothetical protein
MLQDDATQDQWNQIYNELNQYGYAVLPGLLESGQCEAVMALFTQDEAFRKHVVMARHGYGSGEYKYWDYPLPAVIEQLRTSLYWHLALLANQWNEALGNAVRYPSTHAEFLERCHQAGQEKPTPLLLRYDEGDYNCLHQDLYGEHVFPLQVAIQLSQPGQDFSGGEFVLTQEFPGMQPRPEVVPLRQGDAVVFAVHQWPVQTAEGVQPVDIHHGVSRVRSGRRYTAGIIFHDAA